jgi:hypothetical protein
MSDFGITVDIREQIAGLEKALGDDLPFTIARFLTLCAQEGQAAARAGERAVFTLRNDWTTQNTKITPATKQSLFAVVYTDTANRATGAPDYLPQQDEGGEKVPIAGHRFLAIPTRYLFKYTPKTRPIPDNLRPSALLPPGVMLDVGERVQGHFTAGSRATGTHRVIGRRSLKKLGNGDFEAFVQQTRTGTLCIFVKHGGLGYQGAQDAEPWYTLVREAHIRPRFPMEDLVEAAVDAGLDKNFNRAAAEVLVNDLLRAGFSVQF